MAQKTTTRRRFLRKVAAGLPAVAAGGALAHIGLLTTKGKSRGQFPGDPAAWRAEFLEKAQTERGGAAAMDVLEAPVRASEVMMVMDIGEGGTFIPLREAEGV